MLQAWIISRNDVRIVLIARTGKRTNFLTLFPAIEELVVGWSHAFANGHIGSRVLASKTEVEYRQKSYGPDGVAFRIDLQFMILVYRLSRRSVG
jgi:hypothetical protein